MRNVGREEEACRLKDVAEGSARERLFKYQARTNVGGKLPGISGA